MIITHISDPTDPRLDDFRDLKHSDNRPDLPGGKGLVIAEGPLIVERLLASRYPVRTLVVSSKAGQIPFPAAYRRSCGGH